MTPDSLLGSWEGRSAEAWAAGMEIPTVEFHSRIGSTSDRARELAENGLPLPAIVVADRQSAGRGRRGRRWESDTPRGLWLTAAVGLDTAVAGRGEATVLPLRVGLAVSRALERFAPAIRVEVKWPNDIVVGDRKLGGILCEGVPGAVLIGIGLNLNHPAAELPADVAPRATSLLLECGRAVSRGGALTQLADALGELWTRPDAGIAADDLVELNARSALRGRRLSVSGVVRDCTGSVRKAIGLAATAGEILPDGSLEVRDDSGARSRLIAGSVESWS